MDPCHPQNFALQMEASGTSMSAAASSLVRRFNFHLLTPANAPGVKTGYGVTTVAPGNSYSIAIFPCPGGIAISIELRANGNISLDYFQDSNPSPIGLYITVY
jgi:hypothetical protein